MSLKGFRSKVKSFISGFRKDTGAPVIQCEHGTVTEAARLRAAMNMREDPEKRAAVEALLAKQLGSVALGMMEARRRYPEAYGENDA